MVNLATYNINQIPPHPPTSFLNDLWWKHVTVYFLYRIMSIVGLRPHFQIFKIRFTQRVHTWRKGLGEGGCWYYWESTRPTEDFQEWVSSFSILWSTTPFLRFPLSSDGPQINPPPSTVHTFFVASSQGVAGARSCPEAKSTNYFGIQSLIEAIKEKEKLRVSHQHKNKTKILGPLKDLKIFTGGNSKNTNVPKKSCSHI